MTSKLILAAAGVMSTAALVFIPITAEAKVVVTAGAGRIEGYYIPSPDRDYVGSKRPPRVGICVDVQRKTSGGGWTTAGVNNSLNCDATVDELWTITSDTYVSNTYGIRSYNTSTGATTTLCSSKSNCLAM